MPRQGYVASAGACEPRSAPWGGGCEFIPETRPPVPTNLHIFQYLIIVLSLVPETPVFLLDRPQVPV